MDWKVLIPGIGLLGLAVFQFSKGDTAGGIQSFLAALAAFGVKVGFDQTQNLLKMQNEQILAQNEQILNLSQPKEELKAPAKPHVSPVVHNVHHKPHHKK